MQSPSDFDVYDLLSVKDVDNQIMIKQVKDLRLINQSVLITVSGLFIKDFNLSFTFEVTYKTSGPRFDYSSLLESQKLPKTVSNASLSEWKYKVPAVMSAS